MRRTKFHIQRIPVQDAPIRVNSTRIRKHNVGMLHVWGNVLRHVRTPVQHHAMADASTTLLRIKENIVLESVVVVPQDAQRIV